jgi:hypothetical protein
MAIDGMALVDSFCSDYFTAAGEAQKWILFARDLTGLAGTVAAGAVGLASGSGTGAAAIAFSTATVTGGLDVYTRSFLYGADNIESVRSLIMTALATHSTQMFSKDQPPWTF